MQLMVVLLLVLIGGWLALPSIASTILERWLQRQGYEDVGVTVGRPGFRSLTVPRMVMTKRLTGETVAVSLNHAQAEYTLLGLLSGRIDILTLRQLTIDILASPEDGQERSEEGAPDAPDSLVNAFTAGDVLQRLPFFPWDEVRLEEIKVFREQATGPLRTVMMGGTIKHERQGLVADMVLQGIDTIPYELRVTGQSAADMSLQLRAAQPEATPFMLWRSQSVPKETQVHLEGVLEVNVKELAPFLALALPIGSEWQRVGGNVAIHWAGTAASGVPVALLWKDPATEVHATVQIAAALPELKGYGKDLAAKATGTLSGNARLVHWTLAGGSSATAVVSGAVKGRERLAGLASYGSQRVRLESAQDTTGELFWAESPPRFTASGPVRMSYGSEKGPVYAECVVTQIYGSGSLIDRAEAKVLMKGTLPLTLPERSKHAQMTGEIRGDLAWTGKTFHGTISSSSLASFTDFRHASVRVSGGTLQLEEPLPVEVDVSTGRWTAGPGLVAWRSPHIELGGSSLTMQRVLTRVDRLEGTSNVQHAQMTATLEGLILAQSSYRSLPGDVTVRVQADPSGVKADIHPKSQHESFKLTGQLEHQWVEGRGTVHAVVGPLTFSREAFRLGQLWTPWPYAADVTGGELTGIVDIRWATDNQQRLQIQGGSADITADRLAGHYRDMLFSGLSTNLKVAFEGLERISTTRPAEVAIGSLQTGIDVTDLKMTVEGDWDVRERLPLVEVRNIRCELLGGTVTSQGLRADLAHPPYGLTVLARQLDLQKILALEQQKGLQGTGVLDGSIPVTVTSRGLTVRDGSFEARPPGGVIRYMASREATHAVTQANANMEVVLQALNNFQYNVLQVGADYIEDGTLQLKARLEGKNPDQKASPPFHFNLTVQENIPALLKSLRLVNDVEDSVRKTFSGSHR
ncbi:MAG: hypothetical protein K0S79_408 [Nitrospira sp.]|nr:hypothetical protein [Nitrospira sp.]